MRVSQSLFRAARPILRSSPATRSPFFTTQFQNAFARSTARAGRRFQSTEAPAAAVQEGFLKRMWDSPIGIKTVHFWAPVMKWALVLAGVADFARPAESLSLTQNAALTATGAIWTRWCLIIKPRNILLAAVNFFLGCVGVVQVTRILLYQQSVKDKSATSQLEEVKDSAVDAAKNVKEEVKAAVSS